MSDAIIDEEYIALQRENLITSLIQLNGVVDLYVEHLNELSQNTILEGRTAVVLETYIEYAKQLKGNLKMIAEQLSELLYQYLSDIEAADRYSY